jgi:SNF2 family DNA or RNA helicase
LRKLVISAALLVPWAMRDPNRRPSSKIDSIIRYIERRLPPTQKALIFCDWQMGLDELSHHLSHQGISHTMLLASMTADERRETIHAFGASPHSRVILITLRLAVGIDGLQQWANHVLFMGSWWQAKIEKQAFCRVERPGQRLPTYCTKFIVHDSVDNTVLNTNMRKEERTRELFAPLRGQ